jgi:ATP-dependent RNA helicase DeaD
MSDASVVESEGAGPVRVPVQTSFAEFPVSDEVKAAIAAMGYTSPTEVQAAVVQPAVLGHDMLVQSRTGSGKTCAFGVPLIERLPVSGGKPGEPLGLVLTPTRELAQQVATEVRALGAPKGTRVHAVYGGVPMGRQTAALRDGVDIVVGTPGRLLDHIRRRNLSLGGVRIVVLDEADEMLSMGFWEDVTALIEMTPKERQTMLFSATLPYEVAKAASQYLREPTRVDLSGDKLSVSGIENHIYHVLPDIPKPRQLMYVLEVERPESAIVFCNTRNETDMLAKYLTQLGFIAEPLSGNMKQKDRERVMGRIKSRELRYMVATDVAARGIDINDLSHVVNYSLPEFTEVFLHRVGRTGRIGKLGTAVSLVDGVGLATLTRLQREFGVQFIERVLPPEDVVSRLRSERIMKELSEKASVTEVGAHLPVAQEIVNSPEGTQIVAFLLKSYFNQQAGDAERRSRDLQRQSAGPRDAAQPHDEARAAGDEGGSFAEGEEGGRRRRRRRRRRGRGSALGGPSGPAERTERHGGGEPYYETMDVMEALAGEGSPRADGPAAMVREHSNGNGNGHLAAPIIDQVNDGLTRLRVNIGFDDGFKGRGAVAKKISSLAGLTEGVVQEVESRRDHSVIKAAPDIAELLIDRVDGTPIGKKILTVSVA